MRLLEFLTSSKEKSFTADELATLSGYNKALVARVMRMMTALNFADDVGYETYKANAVTICQMEPGWLGTLMITNEWPLSYGPYIREYLRKYKPCDLTKTEPLYHFAHNGESSWETMRKDPGLKQAFDDAMTVRNKHYTVAWHEKYPAASRLSDISARFGVPPVIVDIGGNQGIDLQGFAEKNPNFQCELILQDQPETINRIQPGLDKRIKPTIYDFFKPQPVKNATIYYLKSVIHDWDDENSLALLSNTAKVMAPDSTLLVHDMVLADRHESLVRADMDILTMMALNGAERTFTEWTNLLANVNPPLKIVKVWSSPKDPQSVIEAVLADST
ncbi:MAG: hypothetical protein Q9165_004474 [Trypethelium subeluteriae]